MTNRLAAETSPYLQQHAGNPVDWHAWNEEALELARRLDKPILLSIGYSACHWCHVMAHESFEDPEVAAVMNDLFVNIKVDREERPDLDQIYQSAHHLLTRRSGGWPLTMFLMPDTTPFFAGTYFPKAARYQLPGFKDLLPRIEAAYRQQRPDIERQNASLLQALQSNLALEGAAPAQLTAAPIAAALQELEGIFDPRYGGLGQAPKFPHPSELEFCLERAFDGSGKQALDMVRLTLTQMAHGGIFDQLGGGFCRYSVDQTWTIPHFEKMLYDNGPLLRLYADAWSVTGDSLYQRVAEATAGWVMREMQAPEGGYYSSLDADSEHEEGKFYVWTPAQVQALLSPEQYAVAAPHYGLDAAPNFEGKHWNLRVTKPLQAIAAERGIDLADCTRLLEQARARLRAAREQRVRPGRDEKILCSWNALMAKGMLRAGHVFDRPDWLQSAQRALDFVRQTMWRDGRLLATHKDGKTHLNAYLDDYAFMLDALIESLQAQFRSADLEFARALADTLLAQFEDTRQGGFFFTSHDHEKLILRTRPGPDNATPSGNGIAALALQRFGHLLGEARYLAAAERAITAFYPAMERHASAHTSLCRALAEWLAPPRIVILRGPAPELRAWQRRLAVSYRPHTLTLAIADEVPGLPQSLAKPVSGAVNAWVCEGVNCLAPIADADALQAVLKRGQVG